MSEATQRAPVDLAEDAVREVVAYYRKRRAFKLGPRVVFETTVWEDPAPEWVVALCRAIKRYTRNEDDGGLDLMHRACGWAALSQWGHGGGAVASAEEACGKRAQRIEALLDLWVGPRARVLDQFLTAAIEYERRFDEPPNGPPSLATAHRSTSIEEGLVLRRWGLPVWINIERTHAHVPKWLPVYLSFSAVRAEARAELMWCHFAALEAANRLGGAEAVRQVWDTVRNRPSPSVAWRP